MTKMHYVVGKTDDERRMYVLGFRSGMIAAANVVRELNAVAGGGSGHGNDCYVAALNAIEAKTPAGEIVVTYEMK